MTRKMDYRNTMKRIELTPDALAALNASRQMLAEQKGSMPTYSQVVNALILYGLEKAREEGEKGSIILTGREGRE